MLIHGAEVEHGDADGGEGGDAVALKVVHPQLLVVGDAAERFRREIEIGQTFIDRLMVAHVRGDDIVSEVSMGKYWCSDLQKKVAADCLQLFGGYGFMEEYPIAADYRDAAVQSIYAGTNEIMKVIIARRLGLG